MITYEEIIASGIPLTPRDDGEIAKQLSIGRTKVGYVDKGAFALWAATTGMRSKIEDHSSNVNSPLRSIALTCKDVLQGAAEGIDFSKPENVLMLNAWISAGELSQQHADLLVALATHPDPVTAQEVAKALEGK